VIMVCEKVTSPQNGRSPAASSDSHHERNSAKVLLHRCISTSSWPKGSGVPDSRQDFTTEVRVSNSSPSVSILRMSICE
jgi:hypothetical protein